MNRWSLLAALPLMVACGSSAGSADAGTSADAGKPADVRDTRYCEILVGFIQGTRIHVDVYNTEGLNDCPPEAWAAVNTTQVQSDFGADVVFLNGPRYWTIDSFGDSMLLNGTPKSVGGIEMRLAGGIDANLGDLQMLQQPYVQHTINRDTEFVYAAGQTVYELVDAQGSVYTMQSYSVQKQAQTIDSLASLGAQLKLPTGWMFRTRVLSAELDVRAQNGTATVVQDDYDNTYLKSQ